MHLTSVFSLKTGPSDPWAGRKFHVGSEACGRADGGYGPSPETHLPMQDVEAGEDHDAGPGERPDIRQVAEEEKAKQYRPDHRGCRWEIGVHGDSGVRC